jgi:hypothetical protein
MIRPMLTAALLAPVASCIAAPHDDSPIGRSWRGTGRGYLYSVYYATPGQVHDARWRAYWLARKRTVVMCRGREKLVGRRVHWYPALEPGRRCAAVHYIYRCGGVLTDQADRTEEVLRSLQAAPAWALGPQCRHGANLNR